MSTIIEEFLNGQSFAVVGASTNREKYGNLVLRAYLQSGKTVYAINPRAEEIEGVKAYADLSSLPEPVHGVSTIVPPTITEQVVEEAGSLGIKYIWMQPGSESPSAIERARQLGMRVIAGGPCLLVAVGFQDD